MGQVAPPTTSPKSFLQLTLAGMRALGVMGLAMAFVAGVIWSASHWGVTLSMSIILALVVSTVLVIAARR